MPRMMGLTVLKGQMTTWQPHQINDYYDMIDRWADKAISGIEIFRRACHAMLRKELARRAIAVAGNNGSASQRHTGGHVNEAR
jgi:hypothetical protein